MVKWKRAIVGAMLSGVCAVAAQASPILSEVYYDAVGSDDGQSFVEIAGAPGTLLDGFVIEGINGSNGAAGPSITLTGAIGTSGLFVLADQSSDGTTMVARADLLANFDFQNGPDSVVLRDGETVLDAVGYGVFSAGEIFAGEGQPAPDPAPGSSLARLFADVDTDDNLVDFVALENPTPGVASFSAVPEPGSALMIGLGLSGLVIGGGRRSEQKRSRLSRSNKRTRRDRAWARRSIGTTSARAERPALERPSSWTPRKW
jgi:hypothetical protein